MIIGLHGAKGSGKDTAFSLLKEMYPEIERIAFADALKLSAARALGIQGEDAESIALVDQIKNPGWEVLVRDPQRNEYPVTGREFLQKYGDEAHRQIFGHDFWIDHLLPFNLSHGHRILVVTDVRYDNEAERIFFHGGFIWNIVRLGLDNSDSHQSESGISSKYIDQTIVNDSSLKKFKKRLGKAFDEHSNYLTNPL